MITIVIMAPFSVYAASTDPSSTAYLQQLFGSTYQSLVERVQANGYAPTSLPGGLYQDMYSRDSSVEVMALIKGGNMADAKKILSYIFSYANSYPTNSNSVPNTSPLNVIPHVMPNNVAPTCTVSTDKGCQYTWNEVDQNYSALLAWARYVQANPNDTDFVTSTWSQVVQYANAYLSPAYINPSINLMYNPILDSGGYNAVYDLLTNVFASQALNELVPIATANGDITDATNWANISTQLKVGINTNLTTTVNGTQVYAQWWETPYTNGSLVSGAAEFPTSAPDATSLVTGYNFINLSPIAVNWYGMNQTTMANTINAYASSPDAHVWGNTGYTMLNSMTNYGSGYGAINEWVLFKGLAWLWDFYAIEGNMVWPGQLEAFSQKYYPDSGKPAPEALIDNTSAGGVVYTTDPGNQEHAAWFALMMMNSYPSFISNSAGTTNASSLNARYTANPVMYITLPGQQGSYMANSNSVPNNYTFYLNGYIFNTTTSTKSYSNLALSVPVGWSAKLSSGSTSSSILPGGYAQFAWAVTTGGSATGTFNLHANTTITTGNIGSNNAPIVKTN